MSSLQKTEALTIAVNRVFANWTALQFAIESGACGNFKVSSEKKQCLVEETLEYLIQGKSEIQLSDLLFARLEEDFFLSLEDESDALVARLLCDLRNRIASGDLNAALSVPEISNAQRFVLPEGACLSDQEDSDDMTDSSSDEQMSDVKMDKVTKAKPVVDEDGWTTMPVKNKK